MSERGDDVAEEWWALVGGREEGPWSWAHAREAAASRVIGPETLVWTIGMSEWEPAARTAMRSLFRPPPPPTRGDDPPDLAAPQVRDEPRPDARTAPSDEPRPLDVQALADQEQGTGDGDCPYCHTDLASAGPIRVCSECEATHHHDCWVELGGCAVIGCSAAPVEEGQPSLPVPGGPATPMHSAFPAPVPGSGLPTPPPSYPPPTPGSGWSAPRGRPSVGPAPQGPGGGFFASPGPTVPPPPAPSGPGGAGSPARPTWPAPSREDRR